VSLLGEVKREVWRCQRAVDGGSPVPFWVSRLRARVDELTEAAAVLRACLEKLERATPEGP
jgi:hypothetical protein